jgi:hypothetical protein
MAISINCTYLKNQEISRSYFPVFGELEPNIHYLFSGKTGIGCILSYYRAIGKLENKMDQILVPPWLGYWVYCTINKYCFPTLTFREDVKGLFVYHQWGFPQKMNEIIEFCNSNGLFCVEDCAHAFDSYYNGRRLGTFGDIAVFSLSKFFPCVVGGAVYSSNSRIIDHLNKTTQVKKKIVSQFSRSIFKNRLELDQGANDKNLLELERGYAIYDKVLPIRFYPLAVVRKQVKEKVLEKRKANYHIIFEEFSNCDYMEYLPRNGITPYVIPVFLPLEMSERVVQKLIELEIESGIYNFDINRNILNPEYKKCIAIPCHQDVSVEQFDKMINIIKREIKR